MCPLAQEISRDGQVSYFLQPTGCGGQVIEARVQDYLARYDVPAREATDVRWAQTCMALEDTVEQLEAALGPVLVRRMQSSGRRCTLTTILRSHSCHSWSATSAGCRGKWQN